MASEPDLSEEAKHRRYERTIGTVTLIATLAAAGFAGGAYVQAKRQADIAQAALIESDHPFLDFSAASHGQDDQGHARITITIKNQGSRSAALQFALFGLLDQVGTGKEATLKTTSPGACGGPDLQKVIPAGGSVSAECKLELPKERMSFPHLAGVMVYKGQLGARWRRSINMVEMATGEWIDFDPTADLEIRINGANEPMPTEKYH